MGKSAKQAVQWGRESVASVISADPDDIYFTGSATESCNLCIFGTAPGHRRHFVTTAIEHKAVLNPMDCLRAHGHDVTFVQPMENGCIEASQIFSALREDTFLVSMMAVNNETGTIQPIREVAEECQRRGILFHCDATQGYSKIPIDVGWGIDMLSLSGHKIYGPKGIGAMYKRKGVELMPTSLGGSQEEGLRPGTLNVPGIVGLGVAAQLCAEEMEHCWSRCEALGKLFISELGVVCRLNGCETNKVPWIWNISIPGSDARALTQVDGLCISKSSACAKSDEPSHVLAAMGLDDDTCRCAIRVSFGRTTTEQDVVEAARMIRGQQ